MLAKGGGVSCLPLAMPSKEWSIGCIVGPHAAPEFLTENGMDAFFATAWRYQCQPNAEP